MTEPTTVGQRIAYYRRRRGLTQEVLASLVGRTTSWLSKVERGERIVDRISVILALSRVLKIDPGALIGAVDLPANGGDPLDPPRGIHAIRRTLFTQAPDVEAPSASDLRAMLGRAKQLDRDGRYEAVSIMLPELIKAGRSAAAHHVRNAPWCLAGTYQVLSSLACTIGELDLGYIAAHWAVEAGKTSGDQLMWGTSQRTLSYALASYGWLDEAGAVCSDTMDAIAPTETATRAGWSVWGSLHFMAAAVAVRSGDAAQARRLLSHTEPAAERVGRGHNDYWEAFGPASVGANAVGIAVESGDPVEALRIADQVDIDEMPTRWTSTLYARCRSRACRTRRRRGNRCSATRR